MRKILAPLLQSFAFIRLHGLWKSLHMKEAPWLIQFGKYGLCGVAAVVAHNALVYLINAYWIPFTVEAAPELTDAKRSNHQILANLIAFPFGNAVAYATNALWVFTGGRHHRVGGFFYFTAISFVSFLAGVLGGPIFVRVGLNPHFAQLGLVVTSAMVNYVCRKFFVFKG
jgi:putative flippase GtrA